MSNPKKLNNKKMFYLHTYKFVTSFASYMKRKIFFHTNTLKKITRCTLVKGTYFYTYIGTYKCDTFDNVNNVDATLSVSGLTGSVNCTLLENNWLLNLAKINC